MRQAMFMTKQGRRKVKAKESNVGRKNGCQKKSIAVCLTNVKQK